MIKHQTRRAVSQMDFRTGSKTNEQASVCSGFPTLTPLPTYTSPTVDSCYSYPVFSDHQNLSEYAIPLEQNSFPISGRLTPQTPEPPIYHEPLAVGEMSDLWMASPLWPDNSLGLIGLGYDAGMTTVLPAELWSASNHGRVHSAPATQIAWPQASISASPQSMSHEIIPHKGAVPSLSISECSLEDFQSTGVFHEDWANFQPITSQLELSNVVAPAPFMHNLGPNPSTTPMWEDVFMHGPTPY